MNRPSEPLNDGTQPTPDEKIKELKDYFRQQTTCGVKYDWKIDSHCHRFYFHKEKHDGWQYILDVYQDDLEEQGVAQLIAELNAAKWRMVLENYSGKQVPCFKDKKFAAATFSGVAEAKRV